ncbi:hypothetical protein A4A49_64575 [Nicotiana attenuata]|uniref:Uncharacterized protein n=1 Tax=Nicotiana attenuata TaxID=49451 RepID=A0A314L230_NICAT|nr:hypothetical protein A4A49_64575 [Nicotiana attenuata]
MDIHRDHILGWTKELWNKWRGQLHAKYVKGKPIQEALKNVPKGARSNRNAANRTKLKMLHHIGSKPIREIIYQKAQIQELVQSELSLPNMEIVEKCFGPQSHSHVFGFGGGLKAKDLKGGTASKTELLAKIRSTEDENQSLKDRLSNLENEMRELRQVKELVLAQQTNFQPPVQENDYSDP